MKLLGFAQVRFVLFCFFCFCLTVCCLSPSSLNTTQYHRRRLP
ncbi:hypothetical protein MC885_017024 [Smutsia gigantea]|nr:hypothetical protein MC885_017024 [Smutsia gigantea]